MPRVINIDGVVDDGTPFVVARPELVEPLMAAFGEDVTVHLVVRNPSGHVVPAGAQRVIVYGARTRPLPAGQLLFQHVGVPAGDGGWDCPIVPADYRLIGAGAGRFSMDFWLVDSTLTPAQQSPVLPLSALIVTPSAIDVSDPATSPVPSLITAFGLPTPSPTGAALYAAGGGAVAWGRAHSLGYSAAASSSWTGAAPATIGAALDRLAAACTALGRKP